MNVSGAAGGGAGAAAAVLASRAAIRASVAAQAASNGTSAPGGACARSSASSAATTEAKSISTYRDITVLRYSPRPMAPVEPRAAITEPNALAAAQCGALRPQE